MLIAIPPTAPGTPPAASVLELEPLLGFARQCRPDAVSLLPPLGADDLPSGAALAAIKDRLEREGLRVVPGCWEVPADAPVTEEGWQAEAAFDGRALLAALGEAGVEPLVVRWLAPVQAPGARQALATCLERWSEEAERSRVRIALNGLPPAVARAVLREAGSAWLGTCRDAIPASRAPEPTDSTLALLYAAGPGALQRADGWARLLPLLRRLRADVPLILEGLETPLAYAEAIGFFRGLLAAGGPTAPRLRVT